MKGVVLPLSLSLESQIENSTCFFRAHTMDNGNSLVGSELLKGLCFKNNLVCHKLDIKLNLYCNIKSLSHALLPRN